jgi:hypothetical protein
MKSEKMPIYFYFLKTWGGFYNANYKIIHHKKEGHFCFNSKEERESYIKELREIEERLNARHLVIVESEGYHCTTDTVLHRVIEINGKRYYSKNVLWPNYGFEEAKYIIEWKWIPGVNDYPAGEDADYSDTIIIEEWITGAFTHFKS